jgi:hypothetical protein
MSIKTNLQLCHKVGIALRCQLVSDPFLENLGEALVNLEPGGIKAQTEWSPVGAIMSEKRKQNRIIKSNNCYLFEKSSLFAPSAIKYIPFHSQNCCNKALLE